MVNDKGLTLSQQRGGYGFLQAVPREEYKRQQQVKIAEQQRQEEEYNKKVEEQRQAEIEYNQKVEAYNKEQEEWKQAEMWVRQNPEFVGNLPPSIKSKAQKLQEQGLISDEAMGKYIKEFENPPKKVEITPIPAKRIEMPKPAPDYVSKNINKNNAWSIINRAIGGETTAYENIQKKQELEFQRKFQENPEQFANFTGFNKTVETIGEETKTSYSFNPNTQTYKNYLAQETSKEFRKLTPQEKALSDIGGVSRGAVKFTQSLGKTFITSIGFQQYSIKDGQITQKTPYEKVDMTPKTPAEMFGYYGSELALLTAGGYTTTKVLKTNIAQYGFSKGVGETIASMSPIQFKREGVYAPTRADLEKSPIDAFVRETQMKEGVIKQELVGGKTLQKPFLEQTGTDKFIIYSKQYLKSKGDILIGGGEVKIMTPQYKFVYDLTGGKFYAGTQTTRTLNIIQAQQLGEANKLWKTGGKDIKIWKEYGEGGKADILSKKAEVISSYPELKQIKDYKFTADFELPKKTKVAGIKKDIEGTDYYLTKTGERNLISDIEIKGSLAEEIKYTPKGYGIKTQIRAIGKLTDIKDIDTFNIGAENKIISKSVVKNEKPLTVEQVIRQNLGMPPKQEKINIVESSGGIQLQQEIMQKVNTQIYKSALEGSALAGIKQISIQKEQITYPRLFQNLFSLSLQNEKQKQSMAVLQTQKTKQELKEAIKSAVIPIDLSIQSEVLYQDFKQVSLQVPLLKQITTMDKVTSPSVFTDFIIPSTPIIPFIIPSFNLSGGETKRKKKKRVYSTRLALLPDFTSRIIGLEPERVSSRDVMKKLNQMQTGLEIRRGVQIKSKDNIMKKLNKGIPFKWL